MRFSNNVKSLKERKGSHNGRHRIHFTLSGGAFASLLEMAKDSASPMNYLLDALIVQAYRRWIEDKAVQKKLEGYVK